MRRGLYNVVMIEIRNASFAYHTDRSAILDLSLDVKEGESVVFFGESGAGKSTLLSLVCGILKGYSGSVEIDGVQRRDIPDREAGISFLPEKPLGLSFLSVKRNLHFAMKFSNVKYSVSEEKTRVREAICLFGLEKVKNLPFFLLGREKKFRLALARSFLKNPKILLVDEPQKSLKDVKEIIRLLGSFSCTKIIASESGEVARKFEGRIFCLSFGSLLSFGRLNDIQKSPPSLFFARSLMSGFSERKMILKFDGKQYTMRDKVYEISCETKLVPEVFRFDGADERDVILLSFEHNFDVFLKSVTLLPRDVEGKNLFVFDSESGGRIF